MKRILITCALATLLVAAFAQDNGPGKLDNAARDKIYAARVAYITQRLGLTPEEAERFWPVYREFADRRGELRNELQDAKRRIDTQPTPEQQRDMVDLRMKIKQRELDLEREYSQRMLNTISAQKYLNLQKAEDDFRNLLIRQLQQRQIDEERRLMRDKLEQQRRDRNN